MYDIITWSLLIVKNTIVQTNKNNVQKENRHQAVQKPEYIHVIAVTRKIKTTDINATYTIGQLHLPAMSK